MANRERERTTPVTPTARKTEQSSVLFSLNELMQLEEKRIEEEQGREAAARAQDHAAKMEAELRLRVADEARRRAELESRRADELARREEDARLEAMRIATIEKARIEALDRARLAELELVHKHEQALRRVEADREQSRIKRALASVIVGATLLAGASGAYYFGVVRPDAEATRQRIAAQAEASEADAHARQLEVDALTRKQSDIQRDLDGVRSANSALPALPSAPASMTQRPMTTAIPTAQPTTRPTVVKCTPEEMKDPVSPCIPSRN